MSDTPTRRAQQRYPVRLPFKLRYQGQLLEGTSSNLSLGGVLLEGVAAAIPFGAEVELEFSLPDHKESIVVAGQVRWIHDGEGIGLQFGGLRPQAVWALQKLFDAHK